MSLFETSKYTIGRTTTVDTTNTGGIVTDIRLYENESTYFGEQVALENLYGTHNTLVGYQTCSNSRVGAYNVVMGAYAATNINGKNNVILGTLAAKLMDNANDNVVIGQNALKRVEDCIGNVVIGALTGNSVGDGDFNTLVGHNVFKTGYGTVKANTVMGAFSDGQGTSNVMMGVWNGVNGSNNTIIGSCNNATSSYCTILGSGNSNIGSDCIIIGNNMVNTSDNVININNQIVSQAMEGGGCNLSLTNNRITIKTLNNNAIELDEYNIQVNARGLLNVKCPSQFESQSVFKDNVDVFKLNVNSVCTFNSNISVRSDDKEYWKIGITSKKGASADLTFASINNTFFTLTDEFQPEILNFTGKHRCKLVGDLTGLQIGMVVVATGEYCNLQDLLDVGIDESIPVVKIADTPMDSRAFGVLCAFESDEDENRTFCLGSIKFSIEKKSPRVVINSVGEGGILVCCENGPVQNGDLLTTSSKKGYAMKQPSQCCMNYTVAKATCDCKEGGILIGCTYKF